MRLRKIAKQICSVIVDSLFPRNCTICGTTVDKHSICRNICKKCTDQIIWFSREDSSNIISSIKYAGRDNNLSKSMFNNGETCWKYCGVGRKIILAFKYRNHDFLAKDIANLIKIYRPDIIKYIENSILVPVPLNYFKNVMRGYNQSMLLAQELAKIGHNVTVKNILKAKWHRSQTQLSPKKRISNIKNVFFSRNCSNILNKHVIVVDDIITTGATIEACCKALHLQGIIDVNILTLSHS